MTRAGGRRRRRRVHAQRRPPDAGPGRRGRAARRRARDARRRRRHRPAGRRRRAARRRRGRRARPGRLQRGGRGDGARRRRASADRRRVASRRRPAQCLRARRGTTSCQSPTMPTSQCSKTGASRSALTARMVPAARTPTMWLNFPLRPDGDVEPRGDGAARDADLAGPRRPSPVGHLAGGGQLGAQHGGERAELLVLVGRDAGAHADHDRRPGRASRRRRRAGRTARGPVPECRSAASARGCRPGAGGGAAGSTPGRTVTICVALRHVMSATSAPANAGLAATRHAVAHGRARWRRPPVPSPWRPRRGRPPRGRTRCSVRARPTVPSRGRRRRARRPRPRRRHGAARALEDHDDVGARGGQRSGDRHLDRGTRAWTAAPTSRPRRAAAPSSSSDTAGRPGSARTAMTRAQAPASAPRRPVVTARGGAAGPGRAVRRRVARARGPPPRTCASTGPSRTSRARACSIGPRRADHRRAARPRPRGPGRGRPASTRVSRAGGTAARPAGSTLQGSQRRSATESTAGSASSTSCVPSSCSSSRRQTGPAVLQPADAAGEGEVEQLGQLGADLPGLPVDGVAAEQDEVEGAGRAQHGGEGARRGQGVGAGEGRRRRRAARRRPPRPPPRAGRPRRPAGPSVTTVHVPPVSRARVTPSATARRQ